MSRPSLVCALLVAAAAMAAAQSSQPGQYSGVSNPPPDNTIIDNAPPPPAPAKPSPAQYAQPAAPAQPAKPASSYVPNGAATQGTDDGIVQVAPETTGQPQLNERDAASDPDGDIVHPAPPPPGEIAQGTEIRVRLLDRLSTAESRSGESFRSRVASDVFQGNELLIPAGAEIDGSVVVTPASGIGGHGSMVLRPETVILPDGSHYRLYAQITGTPGSNLRVGREGTILPGSRLKKDGIEYGGAVGAGAIAGSVWGGPAGALAGTLIGAGAITVHLLRSHPQATLESGAVLLLTLSEPLNLAAAAPSQANAQPAAGGPSGAAEQQAPDAQAATGAQTNPGASTQN